MANKKITELTAVTTLPDAALLTAVDTTRAEGDQNVKITKQNLQTDLGGTQDLQDVTEQGATTDQEVTFENTVNVGNGTSSTVNYQDGFMTSDASALIFLHNNAIELAASTVTKNGVDIASIVESGWNASTNTPTLANTDANKDSVLYPVTVGGTQDFGAGSITFSVGDYVGNINGSWVKVIDNNQSGDTPTLQLVTDEGATTTNNIVVNGGASGYLNAADNTNFRYGYLYADKILFSRNANNLSINTPTLTGTRSLDLRDGDIDLTGGSDGDVLTVQADGSLALETPSVVSSPITTAFKSSDQTITEDNTLTVDSDLTTTLEASSNYHFTVNLLFISGTTADFSSNLQIPSGATGRKFFDIDNTNGFTYDLDQSISSQGSGLTQSFRFEGVINTSSGGTFAVEWAQAVSSVESTTLLEGSNIILTKL